MAYVIMELQTDAQGATAATPLQTRDDINHARSLFHQVAASAAISSVPVHTVLLMDHVGTIIDKEVIGH